MYVWPPEGFGDVLAVSILMKYNTNINQTAWVANWGCELVSNPSYKMGIGDELLVSTKYEDER
jgi:hypothetical protein